MTIDVAAVRRDTPGVQQRLHLNNAGASLMPQPVVDTVVEHLELEARIGGYEAADAKRERIEAVFSSTPFKPGDRILTGRAEYCSNYLAFLQVARASGAEVMVIGDDEHGQIDTEQLRAAVDERAKLIALTHVPTSGGLVNPAAQVGRVAREAEVPFLLDACQSVGQMPIDVQEIGCDFLSTTGRKFL